MICCTECFTDKEIKFIISELNQEGKCEVCGSTGVKVCDVKELTDIFEPLLEIYSPINDEETREREVKLLNEHLRDNWDIFSITNDKIQELIQNICSGMYKLNPDLFNKKVELEALNDSTYLKLNSLLFNAEWETFVKVIKHKNRFHLNGIINLKVLKDMLEFFSETIEQGKSYYRARLSNSIGYKPEEMGPPPAENATSGRANSQGIPCLYLSNNAETTLYEIRARVYDYVSVGEFILMKDIKLVNLNNLTKVSPFRIDNITQYAVNKPIFKKISEEITKPLRRNDSELDYLPTQYLTDYIKSLGYDGIIFNSTISPNGYNLAIFNIEKVECIKSEVIEVTSLKYESNRITNE